MAASEETVLARVPTAAAVVVGSELVVHDRSTVHTHVLNETAALVWRAVDGRPPDEVVTDVAAAVGLEPSVVEAEVLALLDELRSRGLVRTRDVPDTLDAPGPAAADVPPPGRAPVDLAGVPWCDGVGPRDVAGVAVELRTDDPSLVDVLAALVGVLPAAAGPARELAVLAPGAPGAPHRVVLDGVPLEEVTSAAHAVEVVRRELNRLAQSAPAGRLLLHGGAVERDGRVIAVVGASGRGKSTLTAALVQRGFAYVTDEVVIVDPRTRTVTPFPKGLDLDDDALGRLGIFRAGDPLELPSAILPPAVLGEVSAGGELVQVVVLADGDGDVLAGGRVTADLVALVPHVFGPALDGERALAALRDLCASVSIRHRPRGDLDATADQLAATFDLDHARPSAAPSARPARSSSVGAAARAGRWLLVDTATGAVHRSSDSMRAVWERCDGRTEVADLVADLAAAYDVPVDAIDGDVRGALDALAGLGLLDPGAAAPTAASTDAPPGPYPAVSCPSCLVAIDELGWTPPFAVRTGARRAGVRAGDAETDELLRRLLAAHVVPEDEVGGDVPANLGVRLVGPTAPARGPRPLHQLYDDKSLVAGGSSGADVVAHLCARLGHLAAVPEVVEVDLAGLLIGDVVHVGPALWSAVPRVARRPGATLLPAPLRLDRTGRVVVAPALAVDAGAAADLASRHGPPAGTGPAAPGAFAVATTTLLGDPGTIEDALAAVAELVTRAPGSPDDVVAALLGILLADDDAPLVGWVPDVHDAIATAWLRRPASGG